MRQRIEHGIGGLALATGRPVRTDDFLADPRFRADRYISMARMDGIISCMAVPIVTADGVVGVLYANNFTPRPFSALDEAALFVSQYKLKLSSTSSLVGDWSGSLPNDQCSKPGCTSIHPARPTGESVRP